MGLLVSGKWVDQWYETEVSKGEFQRQDTTIRNWITNSQGEFQAESGRYHLYVSLACPWAHRTLIFRKLKELDKHISASIVSPDMLEHGWTFDVARGSSGDGINHAQYLHEVYTLHDPGYTGRVTVPVLWDKHRQLIVNNESADIIRILNTAFNAITRNFDDYYPENLQQPINKINEFVYKNINNGVYRCGFATTQSAYDRAYRKLFRALDFVEGILGKQGYLAGDVITEADWRLFTTLIRFDAVYHGHFKCNKQRIEDYANLSGYLRALYQWPQVAETVDFHHIKRHYYFSHTMINPTQIVPIGPKIDYLRGHLRDKNPKKPG